MNYSESDTKDQNLIFYFLTIEYKMKGKYKKARVRKAVRQVKAPNGNAVKLGRGESLSLTEFKAVRKMLPRVETKMAPVSIFEVRENCYAVANVLPNIPIYGSGIAGSASFVYGVDKIRQGAGDGQRIGSRISVKKLTSHIQFCIDTEATSPTIDPGPYQVRWFIYRVKGILQGMGAGGLPLNVNGNWKAMYDNGNDVYTAPSGGVNDMYRKINANLYTVYKQGVFTLQTPQRRSPLNDVDETQPMLQSDSKAYKHISLDLTKLSAKVLKYGDDPANPTNQCTNDALYLTWTVVRYDNHKIDEAFQLNCTMVNTLLFTDA